MSDQTLPQAKAQPKALSLSSRVLAVTFGVNYRNTAYRNERTALILAAQREWLAEAAALAGLRFEARHGNTFVLLGPDVELSDYLSESGEDRFLAYNLTPKFPQGPNGKEVVVYFDTTFARFPKPADVRLTPGMSPEKAAKALSQMLPALRDYRQRLDVARAATAALLDRTDTQARLLLAAGPADGRYTRTDRDNDGHRDVKFYPANGAATSIDAYVWDRVNLSLNQLPLALAAKILALVKAYQKPA